MATLAKDFESYIMKVETELHEQFDDRAYIHDVIRMDNGDLLIAFNYSYRNSGHDAWGDKEEAISTLSPMIDTAAEFDEAMLTQWHDVVGHKVVNNVIYYNLPQLRNIKKKWLEDNKNRDNTDVTKN